MEQQDLIEKLSGLVWGGSWGLDANGDPNVIIPTFGMGPMAILLLGTGLYMMIRLGGRPLRRFGPALKEVWDGRKGKGDGGSITPWQALSTALSGQVGTGNLAGVATAITLGGPGAIFWMWVTAIFGMALAFAESSLAVKYREKDEYGRVNGGPMYYIKNGLGKSWAWLAIVFCIGTLFSATATGGMIQSNSITQSMQETSRNFASGLPCAITQPANPNLRILAEGVVPGSDGVVLADDLSKVSGCQLAAGEVDDRLVIVTAQFDAEDGTRSATVADVGSDSGAGAEQAIANWLIGVILAALVFAVIIGGIKSIGSVAGKVVPMMAMLYVGTAFIVLVMNAGQIPQAFASIFAGAIGWDAAAGGFSGAMVAAAIRAGIARGLFSNEAGQGSAPIAHAAAQTKNPVEQGEIAMIGVFIDTIVICTMTALVILCIPGDFVNAAGEQVRYAYQAAGLEASAITTAAYANAFPGGEYFISFALLLFAFTTILGWSYYAEQAVTYVVGEWATHPFRYLWVLVVFIGTLQQVTIIWKLGDLANASMALPNLIAIIALSGVVIAMHRQNYGVIDSEVNEAEPKPAQ